MTTTLDIQQRLAALGYSPGALDGKDGPKTRNAMMAALLALNAPQTAPAAPVTAKKTSAAGRSAISRREGNVLEAYQDSGGVWTIGVGHTSAAGPPTVARGLKITAAQSDEILARDLAGVEATINSSVTVPLTQSQFDALVSLTFNIGGGAFKKSTLLRLLNGGDYSEAADQFLVWNKVNGKTVQGLSNRRRAERAQFLS